MARGRQSYQVCEYRNASGAGADIGACIRRTTSNLDTAIADAAKRSRRKNGRAQAIMSFDRNGNWMPMMTIKAWKEA